jgi:hypothetical protein
MNNAQVELIPISEKKRAFNITKKNNKILFRFLLTCWVATIYSLNLNHKDLHP